MAIHAHVYVRACAYAFPARKRPNHQTIKLNISWRRPPHKQLNKRQMKQAFPHHRAALFELPLSPAISKGNDRGTPVVVADPLSQEAEVRWSGLIWFD